MLNKILTKVRIFFDYIKQIRALFNMECLIYLIIFALFFICLSLLTVNKNKNLKRVKRPILHNNSKIKNKETLMLKNLYNLKNLEILFLDITINKLKHKQNLILQNSNWKVVPSKLMFYVPKSVLKVNNSIYSIIVNEFNNISFTSDLKFSKCIYSSKEWSFYSYFKINHIKIDDLVTFDMKTYVIFNTTIYITLQNILNEFLLINLVNKSNESACYEFSLKLEKFDYYNISKLGNKIILCGEIFKRNLQP